MPGFELFGEEERREVDAVMRTGIIARYGFDQARDGIWKAQDLEQALCSSFDCAYAQMVSSGTAALVTAMAAMNIGAGHEVILPTFGDVACFEAIISLGAIPVFVDIDETLTIDPQALEEMITPRTRAVMLVHTAGSMGRADAIKSVCDRHQLLLLEDASQAIGATYLGKASGTFGDAGVLSFDFYSTITCGEGGAVLTNDANLYKLCNEYSDHGHDHLGDERHLDQHRYLGTNYRISELHAAVGLAQLRKLPDILSKQRNNHTLLKDAIGNVSGLCFREIPDACNDSCTHLSVLLPSEEITGRTVEALATAGIPFIYWYDNKWHYLRRWEHFKNGSWMNRLYDDQKKHILQHSNLVFPMSDAIMSRCISFAISLNWTEDDARQKGSRIAEVMQNIILNPTQQV